MPNPYYQPSQPRRILAKPFTTAQLLAGVGRCSHCPGSSEWCDECHQLLLSFRSIAAWRAHEDQVQAALR